MSILQEPGERNSPSKKSQTQQSRPSAAEKDAHDQPRARAALVAMDASTSAMLADCFQQFRIEAVEVSGGEVQRLREEKFDACVLRLVDGAENILDTARSSPVNFRMVVYGIVDAKGSVLRFSRYGINIILDEPLDKRAALRAVRGSHLLVLHEFRRYVRIPMAVAVTLRVTGRTVRGISVEISGGGMSVQAPALPIGTPLEIEFSVPDFPAVRIQGMVARSAQNQLGLRFDESDPARAVVRSWIDSYLGIS